MKKRITLLLFSALLLTSLTACFRIREDHPEKNDEHTESYESESDSQESIESEESEEGEEAFPENPAEDFTFAANEDGTLTLCSYKGKSKTVDIPATVEGKAVTAIGHSAFKYGRMTAVRIPETVTAIEGYAFFGCTQLQTVTYSNSLTTIGEYAFYECGKLQSAVFPASLTEIGNAAFLRCAAIEEIRLPKGIQSLGDSAFSMCSSVQALYVPNSVTEWGYGVFSSMDSLQTLELEEGLEKIGSGAFSYTPLTEIKLPHSLKKIGPGAFNDTLLQEVVLPDGLVKLESSTFYGCTQLESVTLGSSLEKIADRSFYGCEKLCEIKWNDRVREIGEYAFVKTGFVRIELPQSVESIGNYAFEDCLKLEELVLNEGLLSIGDWTFLDMGKGNLTELRLPTTLISCGNLGGSSVKTIYGQKGSLAEICAARYRRDFIDTEANYTRLYSEEPTVPSTLAYWKPLKDEQVGYAKDPLGDSYVSVEPWNAYFKIDVPSEMTVRDLRLFGDSVAVLLFDDEKSDVMVLRLGRDGAALESNFYELEFDGFFGEDNWRDEILFNLYREDCFYICYLPFNPKMPDSEMPEGKSIYSDWPIMTYQSTDFGKTWVWVGTRDTGAGMRDYPELLSFVTREVGIVTYRYWGYDDCRGRTYITSDGGKTWTNLLGRLDYPFVSYSYTEVEAMTYSDGLYCLTVRSPNHDTKEEWFLYYTSDDLQTWELESWEAIPYD